MDSLRWEVLTKSFKCDINARDNSGCTPLMYLAKNFERRFYYYFYYFYYYLILIIVVVHH